MVVYTHKDPEQIVGRLTGERIHRVEALELYAVDRAWLAALAERLTRRMAFTLTISERHVYFSLGEETLSGVIQQVPIRPR